MAAPTQVFSTYMHGKEHDAPGALSGAYNAFREERNTALAANRVTLARYKRIGVPAAQLKRDVRLPHALAIRTPRNVIGYNALNRLINELPGPTRRRRNSRKAKRTRRNRRA